MTKKGISNVDQEQKANVIASVESKLHSEPQHGRRV